MAVFVSVVVEQSLPDGWNVLVRSAVVGAVTLLLMIAAATIRAGIGE